MHAKHKAASVGFVLPKLGAGCGVFDYASRLANAMEEAGGRLDGKNSLSVSLEDMAGFKASITTHGGASLKVLHYSGYGYAKRGAPLNLVKQVAAWRRLCPAGRLVTMFHEVAASGPPTTSAFWLRPLQLWVAKRLQQISDEVLTNCSMNANILHEAFANAAGDIRVVPVFSNFGEPVMLIPTRDRKSQMVIFTSNFGGKNPPLEFWQGVVQAVAQNHVARVVLIGHPLSQLPKLPFPVQQSGFLGAGEVSELLDQSCFGYAFFGPKLMGKSGIFAAFAAHGVVPLVPVIETMLPDGLTAGLHYLRSGDDSSVVELEAVQAGLLQWYRHHDLPTTAAVFIEAADRLYNSNKINV